MEISIFAPPLNCYTQLLSKTRCWVHLNYNHISVFALLPQKFLFIHPCQRTPKHHMALNGNFNGHPIELKVMSIFPLFWNVMVTFDPKIITWDLMHLGHKSHEYFCILTLYNTCWCFSLSQFNKFFISLSQCNKFFMCNLSNQSFLLELSTFDDENLV